MGRRSKRLWDDERTELLDQAELLVEKGKGGRNYFRAWLVDQDVENCPLCGGNVIKVQDLFSKTYNDLISDGGKKRVISLEYQFYKWRCLDEKCRHIFARDIDFATKYDNVTHRLEDEIARLVITGYSYGEICDQFDGPITRQAIGQIFNRWVRSRDDRRRIFHPLRHLAVLSGRTDRESYTLFLNLDKGIRVFDVLYGIDSADIAAILRKLDRTAVQTVLSDCDPIIAATVKDNFPDVVHIIPVDYWFRLVTEDFADFAHEKLKWIPVRDKAVKILQSKAELGAQIVDLQKIFESRPSLQKPYEDFNRLREMITRRDELWVYDEVADWIESVDTDFQRELSVTKYQLEYYRQEIEAHMNHRDDVPDRLYLLTSRMEELLKKKRTFSTEVLKARVLYSRDADLQDWRGIPIEDVIATLEDIEKKRRSKS